MSQNTLAIKYILAFCFLISFGFPGLAQKSFFTGTNLGAKAGASRLLTEIPYSFSETINEFDNKAGFAFSLEASKFLSSRWETGLEWNNFTLKGNTYTPEFSAEGGFQEGIPAEITEPVEYNSHLNGLNLLFRYYFKPVTEETAFNPFVRFGGGILHYKSVFKYIDSEETIFGTDKYNINLNTPVFNLGTGFKTTLSTRFYMVTSFDFNLVPYDFLDVMHNYDQDGNRNELLGLYAEFKVGIFYNLSPVKQKKGGSARYSASEFLPFARR